MHVRRRRRRRQITSQPQLAAFQISRGLATFFETCDVFLSPTLCAPPLRIGEIDTMSQDLSHIAPILRRYMPGASMFNL